MLSNVFQVNDEPPSPLTKRDSSDGQVPEKQTQSTQYLVRGHSRSSVPVFGTEVLSLVTVLPLQTTTRHPSSLQPKQENESPVHLGVCDQKGERVSVWAEPLIEELEM